MHVTEYLIAVKIEWEGSTNTVWNVFKKIARYKAVFITFYYLY